MCGRARCTLRADDVPRACYRSRAPTRSVDLDRYRPSYNVAPGWNVAVVRREEAGEEEREGEEEPPYAVHSMKWGLIPTFTKKTDKPDFYKMFNARAESVAEKASFRRLLPKNRCLVAAEGFYEWKKDGSKKQPYYVHFKDGRPLVFAALYDSWKNSEGEVLYTFTIITTSSSPALEWLHDRMPVILGDKGATDSWLNDSTTSKLDEVLKPYKDSDLVWYPVTPAMGKLSYDGPECVKEIKLKTEDKSTILKLFSKRQIKDEKEPKVEERITLGDSAETNLEKIVKEEQLDIDDKFEDSSVKKVLDQELEPKLPASPTTDDTKRESKRDHGKFQTDSGLTRDESNKLGSSPPRKKASLKSGADKQPTLHSYFGKR